MKNSEKLCGFQILPIAPIEVVYNLDFTVNSYFVLVQRANYPFSIYAKLSKDLSTVEEVYPMLIPGLSKAKSLKFFKDPKAKYKVDALFAHAYFSYNLETGDTKEDYACSFDGIIQKYRNKKLVTVYRTYEDVSRMPEGEVRDFMEKMGANYCAMYYDAESNKLKKFFLGYSYLTDGWKRVADEISFDTLKI